MLTLRSHQKMGPRSVSAVVNKKNHTPPPQNHPGHFDLKEKATHKMSAREILLCRNDFLFFSPPDSSQPFKPITAILRFIDLCLMVFHTLKKIHSIQKSFRQISWGKNYQPISARICSSSILVNICRV